MGSINIRKRGKVYQYSFEAAKIKGKRKQITKSGFRTKAEALEEGNKAYNEYLNAGIPFKENLMSYSDYLDYWVDNYCIPNLKYNTIQAYVSIIEKYLKPYLGKYKLTSLTSVKLNTVIAEICEKYDYSRAYFSSILKVLKASFRDACNIYGLIKYNPALTLRLPKISKENNDIKHLYTQEEIDLILERFKNNDTFTCAFLVSCYTGMRTGEVFALTWENIDLENRVISIKHNVYDKPNDGKGRWYIGTPKTPTGIRNIHICNTLYIALTNYQKKQKYFKEIYGNQYHYYHIEEVANEHGKIIEYRIVETKIPNNNDRKLNLVFTRENGIYSGTDITRYPYSIIHKELGIEKCRFYDLRGSFATKILRKGVEIRDVADILGHKNVDTTENFYISSTTDTRKAVNAMFEKTTQSDIISKVIRYEID